MNAEPTQATLQKQTDGVTVPASSFTKPTPEKEVNAKAPPLVQVEASRYAVASPPAIHPFIITRRDLNVLFASPTLVRQMIAAGWFEVLRPGGPGRETLFKYPSAIQALARLEAGENPPKLPKHED